MIKTCFALLSVAALLSFMPACGGAAPTPPATPDPSSATSAASGAAGDSDGDGIPDSTDKCPDKKEDGQPPDPKDGCPKT
jgi:hypothetical protein